MVGTTLGFVSVSIMVKGNGWPYVLLMNEDTSAVRIWGYPGLTPVPLYCQLEKRRRSGYLGSQPETLDFTM